jgi:ribonuclease D
VRIYNLILDFFVTKKTFYIQDQKSFHNILKDIESQKILGLDTEFIWRNTYYPKLSLIQISTLNKIYIIDCIKINTSEIENILANENILKIFHSIRGDSSVIYNCLGIKTNNIFDTQLAEEILAKNEGVQISYKKLVKKYCFKNISKSETNSDWEKRPLREKQLVYAAEDVRYLHTIMKIQYNKLKRSKSLEKFKIKCDHEKSLGEENFSESRLKRFRKKNKNISKIDIEIFSWRENQAEKLNVPPSHIFEDRDLKKIKINLNKKNFEEFRWMIKKDSSRDEFIKYFL